jgi:hypothetical protein
MGVVHPITKEMITKYTKLMDNPALKGLWVPAMSKELNHPAQGKEGVTVGTTPFSISPMLKSGAFQKIKLLHTHELSSTTAPQKTTQIKFESLMAATSLIIRTNSPHI